MIKTACVLLIGNEILSGRVQDLNLNYIARRFAQLGIRLAESRIVPDLEDAIIRAVNDCRPHYDYVLTTGGIGPTHDDITAASVAKAFGVGLIRHPDAVKLLTDHYGDPALLNAARLKMADVPVGAELIGNVVSGAPGFKIGNVFVFAGVPKIMQAMFELAVRFFVQGPPILSRAVTAPLPESTIAEDLGRIQARFPETDIGSYPRYKEGQPSTTLVARGTDSDKLALAVREIHQLLRRFVDEASIVESEI